MKQDNKVTIKNFKDKIKETKISVNRNKDELKREQNIIDRVR